MKTIYRQVKNPDYNKHLKCTHPESEQTPYHDSAVVCKVCKSVISQNGEKFDEPHPLSIYSHPEYILEEIQLPTQEEIQKVIEDTEYQMFIETDEVIAGHLKYKYVAKAIHNFLLSKLK